ncbi:MAG TPA: ATP-binding protein [Spirillospora sp.]
MKTTPAHLTAQTDTDRRADASVGATALEPDTATEHGAGTDAGADGDAPARPMPGWVWALPGGPGCAGHARTVLRDALASLGVCGDVIADAQLMVSELATNAHQHAGDHGPHELWLYVADDTGELRCAVFDGLAESVLPRYSWTSGDCGRGLGIVSELSGGRWGTRRTQSRLGPAVRGKAVWFTVPGATAPVLG